MRVKGYIFLMIVTIYGCKQKQLSANSYINYIESEGNGFLQNADINGWSYRVQYKPAAYIYLQESKSPNVNENLLHQREDQLKGWVFFNVYAQHKDVKKMSPLRLVSSNLEEYNSILHYYLNENKMNFRLYTSTDTVFPQIYVFENNYNLSPQDVFVLGFKLRDIQSRGSMTLSYNDEVLKTGIVKFNFSEADLKNEPSIIF